MSADSQAAPPAAALLPADQTKAFLSIPDYARVQQRWAATQFALALNDEKLEPLNTELLRRFGSGSGNPFVGLTWEDIGQVAGGEVSAALVDLGGGEAGVAWLVDTQGKAEAVSRLLAGLEARYAQHKTQRAVRQAAGSEIVQFVFPPRGAGAARTESYLLRDERLIFCDHPKLAARLAGRFSAAGEANLAGSAAFVHVAKAARAADAEHDALWFIEPLGCYDLLAEESGDEADRERLKRQGFHAVQAIGGTVRFGAGPFDLLHRTAVYAPGPFERAARMLDFPTARASAAPGWLPADFGRLSLLEWNLEAALAGYGSWFDEVYGEGEEGIFEEVLIGILEDPGSPGVDVRKDLLDHLQGPLVVYRPPGEEAGRSVMALQALDPQQVATAVRKLLEGDPDVVKWTAGAHTLWVFREPSEETALGPDLTNYAVTVAHGYLLVASHWQTIEALLKQPTGGAPLAASPDYQQLAPVLERLGSEGAMLRQVERLSVSLQPLYEELKKTGAADGAASAVRPLPLLLALADRLSPGGGQVKLDWKKLPDYAALRPYLHKAALVGQNVESGWLLTGAVTSK